MATKTMRVGGKLIYCLFGGVIPIFFEKFFLCEKIDLS